MRKEGEVEMAGLGSGTVRTPETKTKGAKEERVYWLSGPQFKKIKLIVFRPLYFEKAPLRNSMRPARAGMGHLRLGMDPLCLTRNLRILQVLFLIEC